MRDSNPHSVRNPGLSRMRLPVPPTGRQFRLSDREGNNERISSNSRNYRDGIVRLDESVSESKEPNNTVLARRVSLDLTPTGFGDRYSAVKLPTHEEQEAEYRQRNSFPPQVPLTGFEPATS